MIKTAIRFILYDKAKSIGALAGTIMSVFLVGQQCGIFIFLTDAMASLVKNNPGYVWVVDDRTTNVNALSLLNTRIGYELKSIEGIENVYPLIVTSGGARFENGKSSGITIIGVQVPAYAGGPWNLTTGSKENIIQEGAIITDYFDKKNLGDVELGQYFEVNGKKVFNAGLTKGVRAFGSGAYTFTTVERARYLGNVPINKASAFLVKVKNPVETIKVIQTINSTISGVKAWTSDDFSKETIITVLKSSGIAISFGTLIFFALIVGFVIIGLTLYSAAIDRIRDYGTLKAIGATNGYIRRLIITQAMIFAVTGFIIGTLLVEAFRNGIANAGTIFNYPVWLRVAFFLVTVLIAFFGSSFAIRRIVKLEPAQVFRG